MRLREQKPTGGRGRWARRVRRLYRRARRRSHRRRETSLVGSIGVLFQYPNVTDLLKTHRRPDRVHQVLPAQGRAHRLRADQPRRRATRSRTIVMDSYAWFKELVQKRRNLDDATLAKVSDGRVFTGRQGLALKLVDELGGERTAIAWLAKEKNIDPEDAGARFPAARSLQRPAVPAYGGDCDARRPSALARSPAGSRSSARSRPSSASTLTVYWPFGTLPLPTRGRAMSAGRGQGAATDDQVRARAAHRHGEPASLPA